jgi:hypothetical protein
VQSVCAVVPPLTLNVDGGHGSAWPRLTAGTIAPATPADLIKKSLRFMNLSLGSWGKKGQLFEGDRD